MKKQQINLGNLAQVPQMEDYQHQPVQNYGMTLLKGMGFDQSKGIGKRRSNQLADIFVLKPRPKGLGLGAQAQQQKQQKLEIGDKILITQQPHKGLIGYVNQRIDDETYEIQLHPSKSKVKVEGKRLKKISKKQMKQLQKEADKQKDKQRQRKKKKLKWVIPNIRIKVTNPKSLYYLKKVVVTDLLTEREFECRDQKGNVLTNIYEEDVQTALPKTDGIVLIVKGIHKGCKAKILQRKKSKGSIVVQTLEQLDIINLQQDDVAQFVQF